MAEFVYRISIPTTSGSKSLVLDDALYFASHTSIYRVANGSIALFSSTEGTVNHFAVNSNNIFICTDDRVYMNHRDTLIGSLRRRATSIAACDTFFVIGTGNSLEIWAVPTVYRFTLFRCMGRLAGHSQPIVLLKIVDGNTILAASEDNSVRVFDIAQRSSRVVATVNDRPVGLHLLNENCGAVTSRNGLVVFFGLNQQPKDNRKLTLEENIVDSGCVGGKLLLLLEADSKPSKPERVIPPRTNTAQKNAEQPGSADAQAGAGEIDPEIIKPLPRRPGRVQMLRVLADDKTSYEFKLSQLVEAVEFSGSLVALKSPEFVGLFDISTEKFVFSLDLPKIVNFTIGRGLVAAACADRRIRLYVGQSLKSVFYDEKSKGTVLDAFIRKGSCLAAYSNGHVSVFNIDDSNCYRSFTVSGSDLSSDGLKHSLAVDFKLCAVDEDGCLLILATDYSIIIVDVQRSKKIEEIRLECPLSQLLYSAGFLYYLNLRNELAKYNLYNGKQVSLQLESTATGLAVRKTGVLVATSTELILYDADFNYLRSANATLEGRHREEAFSKPKPVECVDFDSRRIVCAGRTNTIKILERDAVFAGGLVQTVQASKNKDWENYKTKLLKEKTSPFNKKNFIEVRRVILDGPRIYILTREGISIFEEGRPPLSAIEFAIEYSPEFVSRSVQSGNFAAALLAALRLDDQPLLLDVMQMIPNPRAEVASLKAEDVELLLRISVEMLRKDKRNLRVLEFVKWASCYKRGVPGGPFESILRETTADDFKSIRQAYYLLRNISDRSSTSTEHTS